GASGGRVGASGGRAVPSDVAQSWFHYRANSGGHLLGQGHPRPPARTGVPGGHRGDKRRRSSSSAGAGICHLPLRGAMAGPALHCSSLRATCRASRSGSSAAPRSRRYLSSTPAMNAAISRGACSMILRARLSTPEC
ncbi:unnamed protein product, partial [Prorocentrum cordatum]